MERSSNTMTTSRPALPSGTRGVNLTQPSNPRPLGDHPPHPPPPPPRGGIAPPILYGMERMPGPVPKREDQRRRRNKTNALRWTITPPPPPEMTRNAPSPHSPTSPNPQPASVASMASTTY